jgi:hypothetical protein
MMFQDHISLVRFMPQTLLLFDEVREAFSSVGAPRNTVPGPF